MKKATAKTIQATKSELVKTIQDNNFDESTLSLLTLIAKKFIEKK